MEFSGNHVASENSGVIQEQVSRHSQHRKIVIPRKLDCYQVWTCLDDIPDEEYLSSDGKNEKNRIKDIKCLENYTEIASESNGNSSNVIAFENSKRSHDNNSQVFHISDGSMEKESKPSNPTSSLICSTCDKVFRSKDTMLRHKMCHAGSKPFLCDICQAGYSSAVALKEHKTLHTQQKLYECATCQKSFRQNSSYRRHLIIHLDTYPFECCTCKRRFSQRCYLRSHMISHSGQKPHSCSQCGKAFAHLSDLNRHRIIHTGERPYKCDLCGSSFADSSSRRRHRKEHVNRTMKFMCKECDVYFEKSFQLKKHQSEQHSQILTSYGKTKPDNDKSSKSIQSKFEKTLKSSQPLVQKNDSQTDLKISVPNLEGPRSDVSEILCGGMAPNKDNLPSEGHCTVTDTVQIKSVDEGREGENANFLPVIHCVDVEESVGIQKSGSSTALSASEICLLAFNCNYIQYPDFNSEAYYNWLTDFANLCKLLILPIESDLFNKISQVHKALADVLANPSGLLCSKTNFKVLFNLSQILLEVTNGHLNFMLNQLQD